MLQAYGARVNEYSIVSRNVAAIETVRVAFSLFALERVLNGMQQRRLAGAVVTGEHYQRMRQINDHWHVEVEVDEDGVRQDFQIHRNLRIAANMNHSDPPPFGVLWTP